MTDFKLHHFVLREEGLKWIKEMPQSPKYAKESMVGNQSANRYIRDVYETMFQSAIESSILVSNQEEVLDQLWRHDERINNPIPFLFWKENMLPRPKDAVYSLECAVEVKEHCGYTNKPCGKECSLCSSDVVHLALVTFPEQAKQDQPGEADKVEETQEDIWNEIDNNYHIWQDQEMKIKDLLRDFEIKRR